MGLHEELNVLVHVFNSYTISVKLTYQSWMGYSPDVVVYKYMIKNSVVCVVVPAGCGEVPVLLWWILCGYIRPGYWGSP